MNAKLNTTLSALFLAGSIAVSAVTVAQGSSGIVVRYSDLDLSTSVAARTLYGRIQNAAWQVCLKIHPTGIDNVKCRQILVDAAVSHVNKPKLTEIATGGKAVNLVVAR
jgi:UrcA family protein